MIIIGGDGMANMNTMMGGFKIFFIVVLILIILSFIFTIALIFSSKLKAKIIGKQVKVAKYVLDDNEDILRDISDKSADIKANSYTTTARAIKKGLQNREKGKYCKYCGYEIEEDSIYCKKCGKKI